MWSCFKEPVSSSANANVIITSIFMNKSHTSSAILLFFAPFSSSILFICASAWPGGREFDLCLKTRISISFYDYHLSWGNLASLILPTPSESFSIKAWSVTEIGGGRLLTFWGKVARVINMMTMIMLMLMIFIRPAQPAGSQWGGPSQKLQVWRATTFVIPLSSLYYLVIWSSDIADPLKSSLLNFFYILSLLPFLAHQLTEATSFQLFSSHLFANW